MGRLILHIGAHKTATSYIQDVLALNETLLADHGVIYPNIWPNNAHHVLTAPWRPEITETTGFTAEQADEWYAKLAREHAKSDRTVILSAEPYSRAAQGETDFAQLASRVEAFDEVVILYVLRHQWELLQSLYLQFTTDWKRPPRFESMLQTAMREPRTAGVPLDHEWVIDHVMKGFDQDSIHFANYEIIRHTPDGVLSPIVDLLGWDGLPEGFEPHKRSNVSADPLATYVAHRMNPNLAPKGTHIRRIRNIMDVAFGAGTRTAIFNKDEAEALDARYRASNQALFDRLGGHSKYLDNVPFSWKDDIVQRDQIDEDFLFLMGRRLFVALEQQFAENKALQQQQQPD